MCVCVCRKFAQLFVVVVQCEPCHKPRIVFISMHGLKWIFNSKKRFNDNKNHISFSIIVCYTAIYTVFIVQHTHCNHNIVNRMRQNARNHIFDILCVCVCAVMYVLCVPCCSLHICACVFGHSFACCSFKACLKSKRLSPYALSASNCV